MFTRGIDKGLTGLGKEMNKVAATSKTFVVVVTLDEDNEKTARLLKDIAEKNGLSSIALTINQAGKSAPGKYKVNEKVKHTIVV